MIWLESLAIAWFVAMAAHAVWLYRPCFAALGKPPAAFPGEPPQAHVVICLKGADPFLDRCLDSLAAQDYPRYRLSIVVDSPADEAFVSANRIQLLHGPEKINVVIRDRAFPHCSRKVSSLITAFNHLDDADEIVAICDGDAVAHPDWLQELASGLSDPDMAAVSGNRWYVPQDAGLASLSRYYWNALAVPTMVRQGIIWGGSLAVRASICHEPEFIDWLSHSFSEDTALAGYLKSTGRPFRSLLAPLVLNAETTTVRGYWNFLVRQMMSVRLDHPHWTPVLIHGLCVGLGILVLLPALLMLGCAGPAIGGVLLCGVTLLTVIGWFEHEVRRVLRDRPAFQEPLGLKRWAMSVPGIVLTAVIYPPAVVAGWFTRSHDWRGVHYEVRSSGVTITNCDQPLPAPAAASLPPVSLPVQISS